MALYLVTGGAGFIGSHIATALAQRGDRVRVLDDFSSGKVENLEGLDIELMEGSVTDASACRDACRGVAAVFHQAAQVSVPRSVEDPAGCYEVNVMGTLRLLEAVRERAVGCLIFASSSATYGDSDELPKTEAMHVQPRSPYAASKVAGEHLLRVYGLVHGIRTVSLRYFNIFGPRQADDSPYTGVIALFARSLLAGHSPTIHGDGRQTRDFTYIENAVDANLKALEVALEPGIVINVGGGERVSVSQLYEAMARELASDLRPVHCSPRAGDVRHSLASLEQARALLGYEPRVPWGVGLARTLAWYRERAARVRA